MTEQRRTKQGARYSRAEGLELVERWRESGLPVAAFCRKHEVTENRLRYWADIASQVAKPATPASSDFFVLPAPNDRATPADETRPADSKPSGSALIIVVPAASLGQSLRAVVQELEL